MDVRNTIKRCIVGILMMNISIIVLAQAVSDKTIIIDKTVISESTIRLERVTNKSGYDIEIITRNGTELRSPFKIRKGKSHPFNIECTRVQANSIGQGTANGGGRTIWNEMNTSVEWGKLQKSKETTNFKKNEKNIESETEKTQNEKQNVSNTISTKSKKVVDGESVVVSFIQKLDKDSYWSTSSIDKDVEIINRHILSIKNWTDKEAYINNNNTRWLN